MLSLPRNTHRYFLEPLSGSHHIIKSLRNRFLKFVSSIADGKKKVLRRVLEIVKNDVRSVTGRNLRYLKMRTVNFNEKELNVYEEPYRSVPNCEICRLSMVREIIESRCAGLSMNMSKQEVDDITDYVCGS